MSGSDIAEFGGAFPGTVTLPDVENANGLIFDTDGYTLTGGAVGLLGTTPTITVNAASASIVSGINGGNGLTKSGFGVLAIGSSNVGGSAPIGYTGDTIVNSGTLRMIDPTGFSTGTDPANMISIGTGAVFEMNISTNTGFSLDDANGSGPANYGLGTSGGTTITGDGTFLKTGPGILAFGGQGSNAFTTTMAMTGGVLDIEAGGIRNGGWAAAFWTDNKSGLTIASGADFDMWDGNTVFVDGLNDGASGGGTIQKDQGGNTNILTLGVNNGDGSFSGSIVNVTGGIALVKTGTGTQILSGTLGYNGGTTVNGGTLRLVNSVTGSSNFAVNGAGSTLEFNVTSGTLQSSTGTISGDGTIIKSGDGTLLWGANGQNQTIAMTGGLIDVQAGTLRNEYGAGVWTDNKSSLEIDSGATFYIWDASTTVDALLGSGTLLKGQNNSHILTIGSNDGGGTFSGTLHNDTGTISVTKVGSGTEILSGSGINYNGLTTVSGGRLVFQDNNSGNSNFVTNATLEFNQTTSGTRVQLNGGGVTGTGTLIKSGPGVLLFGASGSPENIALGAAPWSTCRGACCATNIKPATGPATWLRSRSSRERPSPRGIPTPWSMRSMATARWISASDPRSRSPWASITAAAFSAV